MKKEIDYYKTLVYTKWLENKEYRVNLVMGIISNLFSLFSFMIFFSIIGELFLQDLGFEFIDYLMMFFLLALGSLLWRFFAFKELSRMILTGDFNKVLTMPISPFFFQLPKGLTGSLIAFNIFWFIAVIVTILIYYFSLKYIFYTIIVFLSGYIFQIAILNFLFSLAFLMKENLFIFRLYYNQIALSVEEFTPILFQENKFLGFLFYIPASMYGYLSLITLKGNLDYVLLVVVVSSIGILLFSLLTYFNWKYGLKKYEAFG